MRKLIFFHYVDEHFHLKSKQGTTYVCAYIAILGHTVSSHLIDLSYSNIIQIICTKSKFEGWMLGNNCSPFVQLLGFRIFKLELIPELMLQLKTNLLFLKI